MASKSVSAKLSLSFVECDSVDARFQFLTKDYRVASDVLILSVFVLMRISSLHLAA